MIRVKNNLSFIGIIRCYSSRISRQVDEEHQEKVSKVAIIGMPNSGKSTLINSLMSHRICATSDKVHTTTTYAKAVMNKNNSQIIAFDTPGLVTKSEIKKHHLDPDFMKSCRHSIQNSNIIGVVHDASNHWTRNEIHPMIRELLEEFTNRPSFLILNKVDKLKSKRILLDLAARLTCDNIGLQMKPRIKKNKDEIVEIKREKPKEKKIGYDNFKAVYMVSALNGDGIEEILNFIETQAEQKPWEYKNNELTDQKPEKIVEEFVRARFLDFLPQEIPYLLGNQLEYFSDENKKIFASVIVTCPTERVERLVCGGADGKLRQITDRITSDLIQHFQRPVTLTINTIVLKKK